MVIIDYKLLKNCLIDLVRDPRSLTSNSGENEALQQRRFGSVSQPTISAAVNQTLFSHTAPQMMV